MPDYQNGKIYALRSHQTDDIYIGSTTQTLAKRKGSHVSKYKLFLQHNHHFVTSFNLCEYDDMYIELIESYPCDSKDELHQREGHYIRSMYCVNRCIAGRDGKQYRVDNKENIKLKNKQYRLENIEMYAEKDKKYYEY